jgi:hypothetical protein
MVIVPNSKPDWASQPIDGILSSFIWSLKLGDLTSSTQTETCFVNSFD